MLANTAAQSFTGVHTGATNTLLIIILVIQQYIATYKQVDSFAFVALKFFLIFFLIYQKNKKKKNRIYCKRYVCTVPYLTRLYPCTLPTAPVSRSFGLRSSYEIDILDTRYIYKLGEFLSSSGQKFFSFEDISGLNSEFVR